MIMRAEEEFPPLATLEAWIALLDTHCDQMDCDGIKTVLMEAVSGFEEHEGMHDHLWNRQQAAGAETSNVKELFPDRSADQ
jgi:hypothetical protein